MRNANAPRSKPGNDFAICRMNAVGRSWPISAWRTSSPASRGVPRRAR
ncbi:hypothetical protein BMASAVP1_1364 [Burkholderia mallei SAVP1]|nr:hypothetical protein BMASAVP1_1364 [Burkholderia mallei SAVP1]